MRELLGSRLRALVLGAVAAFAVGCGSVQGKNDGSSDGAGGSGSGGNGAAGTAGAGGASGTGGTAGGGGGGGTGGGVACGALTCAPNSMCCNASCGVCGTVGGVCPAIACADLRWYSTCGRSICFATDAAPPDAGSDGGASLTPCTADQKANMPCPTLGVMCDPQDNTCGRVLVCTNEPYICPL